MDNNDNFKILTEQIAEIISQHPDVPSHCYLSSRHANRSMCTLCRELPNLSLVGYGWHNFFPCTIGQVIDERLDMLPVNKQLGFFSDAYCVDWLYVKAKLVRTQYAIVLSDRVKRGQYTVDQAVWIAECLLRDTPKAQLGLC